MGNCCSPSKAVDRQHEFADGSVQQSGHLLDDYTLGKVLGQGGFGIVYACTPKHGSGLYAVKMIDKVESPLSDIKREAAMMVKLAHPRIVKLHRVYYEKVFVCMVMDAYEGGDLIEGMQLHWKKKGNIQIKPIQSLVKQMLDSIAWLHSQGVVHRDVKGDNYLMDRSDVSDPSCKLYLSDFGTVCDVHHGVRLKEQVGTKVYWPLEFFAANYLFKVDVWAVGVVMFGLIHGKFPYAGTKEDIEKKTLKFSDRAPAECKALLVKLLTQKEEERISVHDAVRDPWFSSLPQDASATVSETPSGKFDQTLKEAGANPGIDERRRELVERLEAAREKETLLSFDELSKPRVIVIKKRLQKTAVLEWQPIGKTPLADLSSAKVGDKAASPVPSGTVTAISELLANHSIDVTRFGKDKAKSMEEFCTEVHLGASRLMLDAANFKRMVRVVDTVLLRIVNNQTILIQTGEKYVDGRGRENFQQLPGAKKGPHENSRQVAERLVVERLHFEVGDVKFDFKASEVYEEEEESPSYPGVFTVYRKEIIPGEVIPSKKGALMRAGIGGTVTAQIDRVDSIGCRRLFRWLPEDLCSNVKLRVPKEGSDVSALVAPPNTGFKDIDELRDFLAAKGADVSKFGEGGSKTVEDLFNELSRGEAQLASHPIDGLRRSADLVVVKLQRPGSSDILVEVEETNNEGKTSKLNRMPAVKRRADEHTFLAAQRVLTTALRADPNCITFDPENVQIIEEDGDSKAYPGLFTTYRKHIITATLTKP
mmetsp:Transcript_47767/g.103995  ORF Transcript_47767/g.103995 Transcript_47767/m.103995 type:complete len:764 (-) Transcript_47767:75-2366(-)